MHSDKWILKGAVQRASGFWTFCHTLALLNLDSTLHQVYNLYQSSALHLSYLPDELFPVGSRADHQLPTQHPIWVLQYHCHWNYLTTREHQCLHTGSTIHKWPKLRFISFSCFFEALKGMNNCSEMTPRMSVNFKSNHLLFWVPGRGLLYPHTLTVICAHPDSSASPSSGQLSSCNLVSL